MIFSMWLATSRAFPSSAATQGGGDPFDRPLEDCQVVEVDLGVRRKREL
jgi:hypothetical protein